MMPGQASSSWSSRSLPGARWLKRSRCSSRPPSSGTAPASCMSPGLLLSRRTMETTSSGRSTPAGGREVIRLRFTWERLPYRPEHKALCHMPRRRCRPQHPHRTLSPFPERHRTRSRTSFNTEAVSAGIFHPEKTGFTADSPAENRSRDNDPTSQKQLDNTGRGVGTDSDPCCCR